MTRVFAALTSWLVLSSWVRLVETPDLYPGRLFLLVGLVAAAGWGVQRLALQLPYVVCAQLLVATLALHRLLGDQLLPTTRSMREALLAVTHAISSAQTWPAPVDSDAPSIVPLLLVAAVGVFLVVDLVAVSMRRPTLGSLPLLAAWLVPVSVLGTPGGWQLFAAAALAWLGLMATDQAAANTRWGRQVSGPWSATVRPGGPALLMGIGAVVCAVAVPGVLPHGGVVTLPGSGPGRGGTVTIGDPVADLRRDLTRGDDVELLRITVPPKAGAPSYVRLSVLDEFDGRAWRVGSRSRPPTQTATGEIPPAPALQLAGERVPWVVDVSTAFVSDWLPAPRWAVAVDADRNWRYDATQLDIHRGRTPGSTSGLDYTAVEYRPEITAAVLAAASPDPAMVELYTTLPAARPDLAARLAQEVTRNATNDLERAVALQGFFQKEFTYSTDTRPGSGMAALVDFLSPGGRSGYCEQFAAAMALMARELGMPARVSVGFLRPDLESRSTWAFSAHDLHAWPEIWFRGVGWVGFEPTPTSHTTTLPAYSRAQANPTPSAQPSPSRQPSSAPRPRDTDRDMSSAPGDAESHDWQVPAALAGLVVVLAAAAAPRLLRRRQRARRLHSGDVEEFWRELRATATDLRTPWPEGRSPRATAQAVARSFDAGTDVEARRALGRLVTALEERRYAPSSSAEASREDAEACIDALWAGRSASVARRARWLPRSVTSRSDG